MPFTLAHPAAIIPLLPRRLRPLIHPSSLILGTMAPDFMYFIQLKPASNLGHMPFGFFLINLPLIILLYALIKYAMAPPILALLPGQLSQSLQWLLAPSLPLINHRKPRLGQRWPPFMTFIVSALVGMQTHVIWDSFTHQTGSMVLRFSLLQQEIWHIPVFKWLQHGSSLLGFSLMLMFFLPSMGRGLEFKMGLGHRKFFWMTCVASLIIFVVLLLVFNVVYGVMPKVGTWVISGVDALFLGLLMACVRAFNGVLMAKTT